jgi:hypothetical protein
MVKVTYMEEVTDTEEGQDLMRVMHGSGDRHGRWPGIDEGPCMMVVVTDMEDGQALMRGRA